MKISYNWLKTLLNTDCTAEVVAELLTSSGLEVESIENYESIKGGLKGVVAGEVIEKTKHPDADRLSITKVNIGNGEPLQIVCGASNVAAGQKVLVALSGTTIYPSSGEPITLKKTKIRGVESNGMICAEDELGLGNSHDGILVLNPSVIAGKPAGEIFKVYEDVIFEIGLTPNRGDAASHWGVARELNALLISRLNKTEQHLTLNGVQDLPPSNGKRKIEIKVTDSKACPRYAGVCIDNITIKESPEWLKNYLIAIGSRPINNVVDITNYVLFETGQPLHAFDADKIKGNTVVVRKAFADEAFVTLDGTERKLKADDLMICNETDPMCMAGVFGGSDSGVTESTKNIFLESAYFNPSNVRKTSSNHSLKTDASFRFERGTDPEMVILALRRAVHLFIELAGGQVSSDLVDVYPEKLEPFRVAFSYKNCDRLIGKEIDRKTIRNILLLIGVEVVTEGSDGLLVNVPRFKGDVTREADLIEEVMRIYGYNNVEVSDNIKFSPVNTVAKSAYKMENTIGDFLSALGFNEIMSTSLTKEAYFNEDTKKKAVALLNPLSSDLAFLRTNLLFSGLETISYNQNRKNEDLRFYEFGKAYFLNAGNEFQYTEQRQLALFLSGNRYKENPHIKSSAFAFHHLKGIVDSLLKRVGISSFNIVPLANENYSGGLSYLKGKEEFVQLGKVSKKILKQCNVEEEVYCAQFSFDAILKHESSGKINFEEISKFPSVRRDLALLIDKKVNYAQLEEIAYQTEKKLLKEVNLFDVYEGDKLGSDKKSYAMSFILQDDEATLTDERIEGIMSKLMKNFTEKAGATLR